MRARHRGAPIGGPSVHSESRGLRSTRHVPAQLSLTLPPSAIASRFRYSALAEAVLSLSSVRESTTGRCKNRANAGADCARATTLGVRGR